MAASFKFIARLIKSCRDSITIIFLLLFCFMTAYSQQGSIQFDGAWNYDIKKCSIMLSLQKTDYKLFEPIMVKAEVINHSKIAYDVHNLFSPEYGGVGGLYVKSDSGWTHSDQIIGDIIYIPDPGYYLQPGDTFTRSLAINTWGFELMTYYFDQMCYFPPGKNYSAYYSDGYNISNEIHFNVSELNAEDSNFIKVYSEFGRITVDSTYSLVLSKFPDNVFSEHVREEKLKYEYSILFGDGAKFNRIEEEYQNFFKKYPDSFYMYDEYFMAYYYAKLFSGYFVPYDKIIRGIENYFHNSQLNVYLNNPDTKRRIKYIIKRMEDNLNWKKRIKSEIIFPNPEYWK